MIEIISIVGGATSAVATLYSAWKWIIKPVYKGGKKLASTIDVVNHIQDEFKPNGGGSLRDAINRIEVGLLVERHARHAISMVLDVGVFETKKDGSFNWANKRFCELSGLDNYDCLGFGWINGFHFDDREKLLVDWKMAVSQVRVFDTRARFVNKNPFDASAPVKETFVSIHAIPILDNNNGLIGYIGIVSPIAEPQDE